MMLRLAGYFFIGTVLLLGSCSSAIPVTLYVDVGGSVTLTCSGANFDQWRTLGNENNEEQFVASLSGSKVNSGPGFEERVTFRDQEKDPENHSLTISPVKYTDKGVYQCKSKIGKILNDMHVKVLGTVRHSVPQGESFALDCYLDLNRTIRYEVLNVTWFKDDEVMCQLRKGHFNCTPELESRVRFPSNGSGGDMSIIILEACASDGGRYRCASKGPELKGNPDSHNVTVTVPPKDSSQSDGAVAWIVLGVLAVIAVLGAAALVIWFKWKNKEFRCKKNEASGNISYREVNGEDKADNGCTNDQHPEADTQPTEADSQPPAPEAQPPEEDVRVSVPESQPVGEKSSTQCWQ
ncbi:hypothetical protein MATL_G00221360 [Megalops atlanticus]|uniref:Ig-like domain-containing protein n=1 Tax=Megalops atlanticus TaxID=7932 RepID=A0A9D3PIB3_MEGAT|nr:hypothetical protein MATL_G00221360 [Megalops atlanticus]